VVRDWFWTVTYHLCQNTCFVFLEKLRPWIIKVDDDAASLAKVYLYVARRVLAQAMGHTDPGSRAPERRGLLGRQRFFRLFYFMVM